MKRYLAAAIALGMAALTASPADADNWRRHRHSHSSFSLHFGAPLYYRPYPYYRPPVVVYGAPPPVVVYRSAPPPVVVYDQPRAVYAQPAPVDAVPTSPVYTDSYGRQCREFQQTLSVGGTAQPGFGTACLQPDGTWRIVP